MNGRQRFGDVEKGSGGAEQTVELKGEESAETVSFVAQLSARRRTTPETPELRLTTDY